MIVWQGKGWLVVVIVFACGLAATFLTGWITGSDTYWMESVQPFAASLLVAGVVSWFVGVGLERAPPRLLVDEASGQKFALQEKHTVFWIPVKWCGVILIVGSVLIAANEYFAKAG